MKNLNNGFTLIELLAVIIILAIVALIATPIILNVIEDSRNSANMSQAEILYSGAQTLYASSILNDSLSDKFDGIEELYSLLETTNKKPEYGTLKIDSSGKIMFATYIDGKCYSSVEGESTLKVEKMENPLDCAPKSQYKDLTLNGNDPVVNAGLIPVIISDNGTVTVADIYSDEWYNYESKLWANAVILKNDATSEIAVGSTITLSDIAAYYVWIPRYEYQIFDTDANSSDVSDVAAINSQGGIQIKFTSSGTEMSKEPTMGEYYTHPAFSYDNGDGTITQLNGFWVGKFELTPNSTILPNISSQRSQTISQFFTTIDSFETKYNLTNIDSHLMKNMEWGAMAYLSYSKFGTCSDDNCSKITPNTDVSYLTGGGNYVANNNQSTTGNITGIYDVSGGSWDYVMGSNNNFVVLSGFTNTFFNVTSNYKYFDTYTNGITVTDSNAYARGKYGDATKEVIKWDSSYAYFVSSSHSWFLRGGYYRVGESTGIFGFLNDDGGPDINFSTRAVLWIE